MHTIQDMLRWAMSRFNDAGIFYGHGTDNAWDEAVQLVLPALHLPPDVDPGMRHSRLTTSERHRIAELIIRRVQERVPAAYLTNKAWYAGWEFYVDERVLIPRSPIAEMVANRFAPFLKHEPTRIMDLCTGSGCIAIIMAHEFPHAEVDAIDISVDALNVAERNINDHGLEQQVIPIRSDLFRDLPAGDKYDLIVSNPPYIAGEDPHLPALRHEPLQALTPGGDGLDAIRAITAGTSTKPARLQATSAVGQPHCTAMPNSVRSKSCSAHSPSRCSISATGSAPSAPLPVRTSSRTCDASMAAGVSARAWTTVLSARLAREEGRQGAIRTTSSGPCPCTSRPPVRRSR